MTNNNYEIRRGIRYVLSAVVIFILLGYANENANGNVYDLMPLKSEIICVAPSVVLQDGMDNVSLIYINNTSAKIRINATGDYTTYNFAISIVNTISENYNVKLEVYNSQNIERLSNVTILLHNNETSSAQIIISEGAIVRSSGDFYNLSSFSTIYIKVENLKESRDGESYLHIHLQMNEPNTSIYTLYIITFELV